MRGILTLALGIGVLMAFFLPTGSSNNEEEDDDKGIFDDFPRSRDHNEAEEEAVFHEQDELMESNKPRSKE